MQDERRQRDALDAFEAALEQLLAVHGARWTEHSQLTLAARPGILVVTEADDDDGSRPVLLVACDRREAATFGRRIDGDPRAA